MSVRALAAVLLMTTVAACGGSSTTASGPAASSPSSVAPSETPSATPTVPPSAVPTVPVTPAARPLLVLQGDGLGALVNPASIRQLPFGTRAAVVTTAVRTALGPGRSTALPDCGQGPRTTYSVAGFSLLFDGTKFVGWTDQGARGRHLTAADGTGIGMTLSTLRDLHPEVTVMTDTLGPEFAGGEGGISGFLTGTTPASKITSVYAGETCFFR